MTFSFSLALPFSFIAGYRLFHVIRLVTFFFFWNETLVDGWTGWLGRGVGMSRAAYI